MGRMRYDSEPVNPYAEEIDHLKSDLYETRCDIIRLMPERVQDLLQSYYSCESRNETYQWMQNIEAGIIEIAEVLPRDQGSYFGDRAYCPLCKDGSSAPYDRGFSVPEGLRRHLSGWGNTRQCLVVAAAIKLARNYWHDKFHAAEVVEQQEALKRIEERKKSETLYRTVPHGTPELINESIGYGATARTVDELAWAERRLDELGFQAITEENIRSYVREHETVIVYADPRSNGEIAFKVFKKPVPKRSRSLRPSNALAVFTLKDKWKNDLRSKYEDRIAKAEAAK